MRAGGIRPVPVGDDFPDVAMHVIKAPGVRLVVFDRRRTSQGQFMGRRVVMAVVGAGGMVGIHRVAAADSLAPAIGGGGAGPGRVLPFRFGGQSIAAFAESVQLGEKFFDAFRFSS